MNGLFESRCDDALVGSTDGVQFLDFDRDASSLGEAVLSAVTDAERVDGVRVLRVADAGLASVADMPPVPGEPGKAYGCWSRAPAVLEDSCLRSRTLGAGIGYGAGPMSSAGSGANSTKRFR